MKGFRSVFVAALLGASGLAGIPYPAAADAFFTRLQVAQGLEAPSITILNASGTRFYSYAYDHADGALLSAVSLTPERLVDIVAIPDLDGNGAEELASLEVTGEGWVEAKIKDGLSGNLISKMPFDPAYVPFSARAVVGERGAWLAVLGVNATGRPRAQVRDALSGALVSRVYFDPDLTPFAFETLDDLDGNGAAELVVFGRDSQGRIRAQAKDSLTGDRIAVTWFDRRYAPLHAAVMDLDGNGRDETLVVLGVNEDGVVRAQVKDAATSTPLASIRFENGWEPLQLLVVPDIDDSGAPELAVLQLAADGRVRLQLKDATNGSPVRVIGLPGTHSPRAILAFPPGGAIDVPWFAYLGEVSPGNYRIDFMDAASSETLSSTLLGHDSPPPVLPESFVVSVVVEGDGSVSSSGFIVPAGGVETLTLDPAHGYRIGGVSGCGGALAHDRFTTAPVNAHCTISAVFDLMRYDIDISVTRGGVATGAGVFTHGAQVVLEAAPAPGYDFRFWSEAGVAVSSASEWTFTATTARELVAEFAPRADVIAGSVTGFDPTRPTLVTLSSVDSPDTLRVLELPPSGDFLFEELSPHRAYSISVDQAGYRFSGIDSGGQGIASLYAQLGSMPVLDMASLQDSGAVTSGSDVDFVGVQVDGLQDNRFIYEWQGDVSVSGAEYASYVNEPLSIEITGTALTEADTHAAVALFQRYGVVLIDEVLPWSAEHATRLLQSLSRTGIPDGSPNEGVSQFKEPRSRWVLVPGVIGDDIEFAPGEDGIPVVRVASDAFTYAAPVLATVDGKRGRFFSHRLFRAVTRFITDHGRDINAAADIIWRRYGIRIARDEYFEGVYDWLPVVEVDRSPGVWQMFQPEELIELIAMLEEFPEGMRDLSLPDEAGGLRYVLRRRNGLPHPLYPEAPAVAWTGASYIEFMDTGFTSPTLSYIQRLIIHEKAHFLWDYSFSNELKYEWLRMSGWYRPSADESGGDCGAWAQDPSAWIPPNVSPLDLSALTPSHDHPPREGEPYIQADWASCSTAQFVTAYAAALNPSEDMAESIAYFLTNPDQLRSTALPKYEFIRDFIMQGQIYVSLFRPDLTFEVLNLYPDYIYPGKINRVSIEVLGGPFEQKHVTVTIGLTDDQDCINADGEPCFSGASGGFFRIFSPVGSIFDVYMYTANHGPLDHTLVGTFVLPETAAAGWWTPRDIVIFDQVGNRRIEKIANGDFGWRMYINNPNADTVKPEYVPGSLTHQLLTPGQPGAPDDLLPDERELLVRWRIIENMDAGYCLSRVVGFSDVAATRDLFFDNYGPHAVLPQGQFDGATHVCESRWRITPFIATGLYGAGSIGFGDRAGNRNGTSFAFDHPYYEDPVTVWVDNSRGDLISPVLDTSVCTSNDPEERCIRVHAYPVNPERPDGETIVRLSYWAWEEQELFTASGVRQAGIVFRNPQGQEFFYHHGDGSTGVVGRSPRLHDRYFSCPDLVALEVPGCDATTPIKYEFEVRLPVGSAPGIWGVTEMTVKDHAGNYSKHQFTEVVTFQLD